MRHRVHPNPGRDDFHVVPNTVFSPNLGRRGSRVITHIFSQLVSVLARVARFLNPARGDLFIISKPKKWVRIMTTNQKFLTCWKSMDRPFGLWKVRKRQRSVFVLGYVAVRCAPPRSRKQNETGRNVVSYYKQATPSGVCADAKKEC